MKKIIILFCFFNRREKTLRCLESLYSQKFDSSRYTVEIIAVDDASNDGTVESIAKLYPDVRVITTKGNYYWSKSMNLAMKEAQKCDYDYLLMINCQTAHCGRRKPHFDFGGNTSPIVPYRHLPQTLRGLTADCRSLV